jgi:hypothetical protein
MVMDLVFFFHLLSSLRGLLCFSYDFYLLDLTHISRFLVAFHLQVYNSTIQYSVMLHLHAIHLNS